MLVFSYYQDTIDWMEAFLLGKCETDARLAIMSRPYGSSVGGNECATASAAHAGVDGFAPESVCAGEDPDAFDLLLCTGTFWPRA